MAPMDLSSLVTRKAEWAGEIGSAWRTGPGRWLEQHLGKERAPERLEIEDMQGLILRGYGNLPCCCYVLLQVRDRLEAGRWLRDLAEQIATGQPQEREQALHIAFTHSGLAALGLPQAALQGFAREYIDGMVTPHRSRFLGDSGPNAPETWHWGGPQSPGIHAVLMLFSSCTKGLRRLHAEQERAWSKEGLVAIHTLHTCVRSGKEHFGFADGISQPAIAGYHEASDLHRIKAGEFVLGYRNEYDLYTGRPLLEQSAPGAEQLPTDIEGSGGRDFGRNGTYLVMRQLRQDVVAFRAHIDRLTQRPDGSSDPEAASRLAAQMVGRWPSGAPLTSCPFKDDAAHAKDNEFRFHKSDRDGLLCPIGSHIRRANPRDALPPHPGTDYSLEVNRRHRLIRRGRPYGPELAPGAVDDADRGLIFVALNANIVRQFEFIQHSWLADPRFNGLVDAADPIMGTRDDNVFVAPESPVRRRCTGLPRFVRVTGGAYFFMPGIQALRFLAAQTTAAAPTVAQA